MHLDYSPESLEHNIDAAVAIPPMVLVEEAICAATLETRERMGGRRGTILLGSDGH